jgi:hypothetical protein
MKHSVKNNLKDFATASFAFAGRFFLPSNFAALGASGFTSQKPFAFAVSIFLFDRFFAGFYQGFLWTYLGFAAYPIFGYLARKFPTWRLTFLVLASLSFFFFSNFGVFLAWYPQSLNGFILCYSLALPFFAATLASDLFFTALYFLLPRGWQWLQKSVRVIQPANSLHN